MFKATRGAHRSLRQIAEGKNASEGFDGPNDLNYNAHGGHPKEANMPDGNYKELPPMVDAKKPNDQIAAPFSLDKK